MPSEYAPAGSKPRMTKAQIKKLLEEQEQARKIAEAKLAAAKKSEEWKKEQKRLKDLEKVLEGEKLITTVVKKKEENKLEKNLNLWEKLVLWFRNLFNNFS